MTCVNIIGMKNRKLFEKSKPYLFVA